MSLWSFVSNFWNTAIADAKAAPGTLYNDTVGNLTKWLGNVGLSIVEKFVMNAISAFLTILALVLNTIVNTYNAVLQIGVEGLSQTGILGSILAMIILMGTFLGMIEAVKIIIRIIP